MTQLLDRERVRSVADLLRREDLAKVDRRMTRQKKDQEYVAGLKEEAIRYLALAIAGSNGFSPSKKVDEYWHAMVLHTREYESLCERVGHEVHDAHGFFVHHIPTDGPDRAGYERTLAAYRNVFGEPSPTYWQINAAADCCEQSSCKSSDCGQQCSCGCELRPHECRLAKN